MSSDEPAFRGFENQLNTEEFSNPFNTESGDRLSIRRKIEECEYSDSETNKPKRTKDMTQRKVRNKKNESMIVDSSEESDSIHTNTRAGHEKVDMTDQPNISQKTQSTTGTEQETTQKNKRTKLKHANNAEWIRNNDDTVFFIEKQRIHDDTTQEQTKDPRKIHPMELAKILHNCGIKEYKELKIAGQGRFRITFDRPRQAETLINSKLLKDEFKLHIYVPNMIKESIGVVRNVPPSLTDSDIFENIQAGKKEIIKVERIKKKVGENLTPTYSVKIFVKGQELPDQVTIFGFPAKVTVYVYPLRMCFNCCRYGHAAKACKSTKVRCVVCSLEHDGRNCKAQPRCCHCSGEHKANDWNCPERQRQDKIRHLMASEKLTFIEAANRFPKQQSVQYRLNSTENFPLLPTSNTTYSNVPPPNNTTQTYKQSLNNENINNTVHQIQQNLTKQANLDTILKKIKTMHDTIIKYSQQHKQKNSIDSDILLINICDQIKAIIEPEVTAKNTKLGTKNG